MPSFMLINNVCFCKETDFDATSKQRRRENDGKAKNLSHQQQ